MRVYNIDFRTESGCFSCKLFRSFREEACQFLSSGRLCPPRTASLIGGLAAIFDFVPSPHPEQISQIQVPRPRTGKGHTICMYRLQYVPCINQEICVWLYWSTYIECIHIYIYIYTYTYINIHTCILTCMHAYIHTCVCMCMYVHTGTSALLVYHMPRTSVVYEFIPPGLPLVPLLMINKLK